ncbi:hypothetical protein QR685DRAFT_573679 [Neurospora intermedia]|uniref:Uncharacterized protein n=1 Tax=Neurospora intermedia TaxID=5142 RepID=A0ABR3D6S8_NEUIN
MSLQGEQATMVSILQAATTTTAANLRTASPDSQDIDLLALAASACRARRYRAEEPTDLTAVGPWQGVVDEENDMPEGVVYIYEGHIAVAGQFIPETAGFCDLGVSPHSPPQLLWANRQKLAAIWDLHKSLGYTNL